VSPSPTFRDPALEGMDRFPDANPNPVLRIDGDGLLVYANASSATLREALGVSVGQPVPPHTVAALDARADDPSLGGLEVDCPTAHQTYLVTAVRVPELGVLNLYGTDITAAKVVERFPDRNPNPVLRVDADGVLLYANAASQPIVRGLGLAAGSRLPDAVAEQVRRALAGDETPIEVRGEGRVFQIQPVDIPEFEFTNLYGTDITAVKAVDRFPNLNPNPVLRISRDGRIQYANPASAPIQQALGVTVGDVLPADVLDRVMAAAGGGGAEVIEVVAGDRTFELLVAAVYEFESINLYGTDVTARRLVERAHRENERLLLNILPASIAERLRDGEVVIADRFDEMTVLFADVVDFTPLAARLTATATVDLLNRIFSAFDALADQYELEKIKTVGDAYMVVGGLAPDDGEHAARVADMGLEMIEAVALVGRELGTDLQIRVGLQVGPAIAGVIGIKKFIYDVWGDTVNTASRMESHGVPGRIQVTAPTAERLRATHTFEPRGTIDVKGKGPIEAWLLVGRRSEVRPETPALGPVRADDVAGYG
jgi:class 3 adenylate cyclase